VLLAVKFLLSQATVIDVGRARLRAFAAHFAGPQEAEGGALSLRASQARPLNERGKPFNPSPSRIGKD
jgi:hypothetical protein